MRTSAPICAALAALFFAGSASAESEIVVVDDSFFDFFDCAFNPGCAGGGLQDWNDFYNTDWLCRNVAIPTQGGAICGQNGDPPSPWDDPPHALRVSLIIQAPLPFRLAGLVGQSDAGEEEDLPFFEPYDPAVSGSITSVRGTFAFRLEAGNPDGSARGHLLIEQAGSYYVSDTSVFSSVSSCCDPAPWVEFGKSGGNPIDFGAGDFDRVLPNETIDSSQHPDFSATAAPLRFGFAVDLSRETVPPFPNNTVLRFVNIDDIRISVMAQTPSPVPVLAPVATGVLVALLAVGGTLAARRRQPHRSA